MTSERRRPARIFSTAVDLPKKKRDALAAMFDAQLQTKFRIPMRARRPRSDVIAIRARFVMPSELRTWRRPQRFHDANDLHRFFFEYPFHRPSALTKLPMELHFS